MTDEMKTAIDHLKGLPHHAQETIAPRLNEYLNKLDDLRDTIDRSYQIGEPHKFDAEEIKRRGRKRLK